MVYRRLENWEVKNKMTVKDFLVAWLIWYSCIVLGISCMFAFGFYWIGDEVLTRQVLRRKVVHLLLVSIVLSFINALITIILYQAKGRIFSTWYFGLGIALSVLIGRVVLQFFDLLIVKIKKIL